MIKMYFITTVETKENTIIGTRCVGYFETYEDAVMIVHKNVCDIYEGFYDYAVIEEVSSGLYQYDFYPHWFRFSKEKNCYVETDMPEFAKNICGFYNS